MTARPHGFCPECAGMFALTTQGRIWAHGGMWRLCPGSGQLPCVDRMSALRLVAPTKRCIVHDQTYTTVWSGCRADEIAAEEAS